MLRLHLTPAERTRRGLDAAFSDVVTQAWDEVCKRIAADPQAEIVVTVEAEPRAAFVPETGDVG